MVRKTFTDNRGKSRHLTKWQQEVSKHGMVGAKKTYAGYKQVPAKTTTTGNVRNVKGGTRRVKDNQVGRGKRSVLTYKGDRVGTWTKSGGPSTKGGNTGLGWYMERGYGTAKKPVPTTPLTKRLGIQGKGRKAKAAEGMLVPGAVAGLNQQEDWEMQRVGRKTIRESEGLPVQNVRDGISEGMFGDVGQGNDFGQLRAEDSQNFNAAAKFSDAAKRPGYKAKGNKLYHKGDLVGKRDSKGKLTRKGVNTGRGWYMERGYGTARKPVPSTELTRKIGIAGAGRQMRTSGGLFGRIKRMLVPSTSGINQQQPWEYNRPRASAIREAESGCPNCGFHQ